MSRYLAVPLIAIILLVLPAASQLGTPVPPAGSAVQPQDRQGDSKDSGGSRPNHPDTNTSAQREALYGEYQLSWARIDEAGDHCKTALNADPTNQTAIRCLNEAAGMAVDDQLNQADKLLLQNKPTDAAILAAPIAHSQASPAQVARAEAILAKALPWPTTKARSALPDWIRPIVDTFLFVAVITLIVRFLRWLEVKARTRRFLRRKTVWNLLPLRDLPGSTGAERATDGLLDSMARLGEELNRPPWRPLLLLLRPTPPADYEPAVISDFLSIGSPAPIVLVPDIPTLQTEWNFHEVRLDDAFQNLQLKAAGGVDLGAFLRFLMALGKWISASKPTISGTVEIRSAAADTLPGTDRNPAEGSSPSMASGSVAIHMAARGIQVPTISITTSGEFQPGIDCVQLAAERAAFKFLIRMQFPQMTNDEVNGHAALRQGASLFTEFAGTVPDGGPAAATRTSSLKSAAHNFAVFRSSIPTACSTPELSKPVSQIGNPAARSEPNVDETASNARGALHVRETKARSHAAVLSTKQKKPASAATIPIPDEVRQGALLAEGVALALIDDPGSRNAAISSFRQLQEWPGSAETAPLRQQAAYNEAIVRRSLGFYGQCVLMLTELLGDDIPGADGKKPAAAQAAVPGDRPVVTTPGVQREPTSQTHPNPNNLPRGLLYAARLARLSAFAQYSREDWTILPQERALLLLNDAEALVDDAEALVNELEALKPKPPSGAHDSRMARYMHARARRAAGHIELQNAIQNAPDGFYDKDHRPTPRVSLDSNMIRKLETSIAWMRKAEDWSPTTALYCDIAESYLLCGNFVGAQAYARHATLQARPTASPTATAPSQPDPDTERAFYLASESWFLPGDRATALKYAQRYTAPVLLDEFKTLRAALGMDRQNLPSGTSTTPVASTVIPPQKN